ncbi:Leukotriene A-4 hydrolase-like protein [Zalerion maritima]|uniref:Leukotriene A(4) hydrolase n=1 Tax=Zalerion maritima TaxID=339359 RepID=A0AAD5WR79_9PEZI|nr:Leukotriene A-4 hydrolase-like protein [Zalerion maritima]
MWRSSLTRASKVTIFQSRAAVSSFRNASTVSPSRMARDPNTLSNYASWLTKHTTANLRLDFDKKRLSGSVLLEFESLTNKESDEIILDTSFLSISSIGLNSTPAKWDLKPRSEPFGAPLHISVPNGASKGDRLMVDIEVETTDKCTAVQWLTPAQAGGKHPYMFSQCQAIHCRSLFPCQDTPDVKSTFTFNIVSPLPTVASGLSIATKPAEAGETLYMFEQKVPIPAYLFALASGDIATAPIGPRSKVATSPSELEGAKWELEADMERFMEVAEKIVFPYKWGEYNVLILPPSFPYGGMENPIYTFATPTIISGDRQNVDVIAHELSHSWSGNLVTNCSWEHFWLNEGWTMYLERRIGAAIHGEPQRDFSCIIGWKALEDSVERYGADHEFTKLVIKLEGEDPDDAFSTIPYEKGFHFLYYLERLVGKDNFDKFIPVYFTRFSGKSLDSYEFKATFLEFFTSLGDPEIKAKVDEIDWDEWFYKPGLPPKPDFDTSYVDMCYKLVDAWKHKHYKPSSDDVKDWSANQKLVFLEAVERFDPPLSPQRCQEMGAKYDFLLSQNVEIKSAYYLVCLDAKDKSSYEGVAELLGTIGRMKFVRPLFRGLNKVDRDLALKTFKKNEDFYHPICKGMVEKDLGLTS